MAIWRGTMFDFSKQAARSLALLGTIGIAHIGGM
jgi:hypothetical protein